MAYTKDSYGLSSSPTVTVTEGSDETVSLNLQEAKNLPLQLSGFVRDTSSEDMPISNAFISVYDVSGNLVAGTYTYASGYYSVSTLSPGDYTVRANAPGYMGISQTVSLSSDPIIQNFSLQPYSIDDRVIYGIITDSATSNALNGARIDVINSNGSIVTSTTSIADGEFSVIDLEDGTYSIIVSANGYSAKEIKNIELSAETPYVQANISLDASEPPKDTATISGYIREESTGKSIADAWVGLYSQTTNSLIETTASDTDGYYIFTKVAPGDYIIRAKAVITS